LPLPLLNVEVAGITVDAHWPQWRLVVELDSRGYHMDTAAFERDRIRDAKLMWADQRVLRITHRRLTGHAADVLDDILALAALA
jgi:very-short-patch-repair endonuclease